MIKLCLPGHYENFGIAYGRKSYKNCHGSVIQFKLNTNLMGINGQEECVI